jgi:hypothetical protein
MKTFRLLPTLIATFGAIVWFGVPARAQESAMCLRFFGAQVPTSAVGVKSVTAQEADRLTDQRACIKSYGLPGGAENLAKLSSTELNNDKKRVQRLFDEFSEAKKLGGDGNQVLSRLRAKLPDLNERDLIRLLQIEKGWDRAQVTLYGEWLYFRALRQESRLDVLAREASRIARDNKLSYTRVTLSKNPDGELLEEHTYFSREALGNLILLELTGARARLAIRNSSPPDLSLAVAFLDNKDHLDWFFQFSGGDPSRQVLEQLVGLGPELLRVATEAPATARPSSSIAGVFQDGSVTVTLLKGKRTYGIAEETDRTVSLLRPEEAARRFRDYCRREVTTRSTDTMRLFTVNAFGDGVEIDFAGRTLELSASEVKTLSAGQPLPDEHPLTSLLRQQRPGQAFVAYSHPMAVLPGTSRDRSDSFIFSLQKSYPVTRVIRDPFSERTPALVAGVLQFNSGGPSGVFALIAEDSFRVADFKIVQNIKAELTSAGVSVINVSKAQIGPWTGGRGKGLIVITGHSDAALADFVQHLGQNGYFKDNYVIFNSCRTPLTRSLVDRINGSFGASGTFAFDSKIDVARAEDFLADMAQRFTSAPDQTFETILRDSVRRAGLNGVWTVCELRPARRNDLAFAELNGAERVHHRHPAWASAHPRTGGTS